MCQGQTARHRVLLVRQVILSELIASQRRPMPATVFFTASSVTFPLSLARDEDRADAVRMQRREHLGKGRPVRSLDRARNALICEFAHDAIPVGLRVRPDGCPLPRQPVALHLALAAHAEITECLHHEAQLCEIP